MPFSEILDLNVSAIVFSLIAGPLAVLALRKEAPGLERSFRLPAVTVLSALAFVAATAIILWTGWDSILRLALALILGLVVIAIRLPLVPPANRDIRSALWLLPYVIGVVVLAWLGKAGGGSGHLTFDWQLLAAALFGLTCFVLADRSRLKGARFAAALGEVQREIEEESGATGH